MSHGDDRCALLEQAWTTNVLEQSRTGRHAAVVGVNDGERGDDHHAERLALRHTSCMVRRRFLVVASIALVVTGALGASASGLSATKVIYVAPVNRSGQPVPGLRIFLDVRGHCEPGSDSVPGPTYRCFEANSILDPCWADRAQAGSVLCMEEPWSETVVQLDTGHRLPASNYPVPKSLGYPWGVKLANGEKCLAAQGAHDMFRGRVVDYSCGHRFHLVLLRGMHQSHEPWSFDSAIWTGQRYVAGPRETVKVAWYGGPAPTG